MRTRHQHIDGIEWPIRFYVTDGRLFTVTPDTATGLLTLTVDGNDSNAAHELWPVANAISAGAVIGRTIRWWRETTGQPIGISPSRPDTD